MIALPVIYGFAGMCCALLLAYLLVALLRAEDF